MQHKRVYVNRIIFIFNLTLVTFKFWVKLRNKECEEKYFVCPERKADNKYAEAVINRFALTNYFLPHCLLILADQEH